MAINIYPKGDLYFLYGLELFFRDNLIKERKTRKTIYIRVSRETLFFTLRFIKFFEEDGWSIFLITHKNFHPLAKFIKQSFSCEVNIITVDLINGDLAIIDVKSPALTQKEVDALLTVINMKKSKPPINCNKKTFYSRRAMAIKKLKLKRINDVYFLGCQLH